MAVTSGDDCASDSEVTNFEAPSYSASPAYRAVVIPDTGHDLALHRSAAQSFAVANQWILATGMPSANPAR